MIHGCHRKALDPKGRVVMPAEFRAFFGSGCWLTRGLPGMLVAFPEGQFPTYAAHWMDDPQSALLYLGSTQWASFQGTGRMPVPQALRDAAGLKRWEDVALVGMRDAVLILPWERWTAETERMGRWLLSRWVAQSGSLALDLGTR